MRNSVLLVILILLFSFCFGGFAQAVNPVSPGITPDSPFYFLDTWGEKIEMFFTFGAERKAKKAFNIAEEKMAEVKIMAEKNQVKALGKAVQNYQKYLNLTNDQVQKAVTQGKDVKELTSLIKEKTAEYQEVLLETLEKIPPQEKQDTGQAVGTGKENNNEEAKEEGKVSLPGQGEIKTESVKNIASKASDKLKTATFVKSYRIYDNNSGWNVWPTKEHNYILAGYTWEGLNEDAFICELNQQGELVWTKSVGSSVHYSGPMGHGAAYDAGYLSAQLQDGSYLLVGQTAGYVGDEEAKVYETPIDVFISKFSQDGQHLWTQTVGDLAGDTPVSLWPTDDEGFLILLTLEERNAGAKYVGDTDHYFALAKFDAAGNKEWSKKTNLNIGDTMGTEEQVNFFMEKENDDSFVLVGNMQAGEVSKTEDERVVSHMPTVVKLDKNYQVIWAKSIESIPTKYLFPKLTADGSSYTESYLAYRMTAGNFSAVQKTPDNGYLAIGFLVPTVKGYSNSDVTYEAMTSASFLAVKLDKDGKYQWAKTIATGLFSFEQEFRIVKTEDNDFIIMQNYMSEGEAFEGEKYNAYMEKAERVSKLYTGDYKPGDEASNPSLKKAIEEMNAAHDAWLSAGWSNIILLKVDPNFNVKWIKTIGGNLKQELVGRGIKMTLDKGIVIAGTHYTDTVCSVSFGVKNYCKDILLIKLDANGNLVDDSLGIVSSRTFVSQEDLSQYITIRDLKPSIINYGIDVKRQNPHISLKTVKTNTLAPFAEEAPVQESQGFLSSLPTPQSAPEPKTWEEMNYEKTKAVEIVNDKSQEVYDELMPILNQLFDSKVKLSDNFGGISLDYIFGRLVNRDDVVSVQKYLEEKGYTTDSSEGGRLIMMKVGRTLNMTFSIKSQRHGILDVTF